MCHLKFRITTLNLTSTALFPASQGVIYIFVCFPDITSWMSVHPLKFSWSDIDVLCLITAENWKVPATTDVANLVQLLTHPMRPQCGTQIQHQTFPPLETVSSSSLKFSHLLSGLPWLPRRAHSFPPRQLIQNTAARPVFNLPRPSRVIPLTQSLHWLLVLNKKILLLANNVAKGSTHALHKATVQVYTHQPALLFCHHFSPPVLSVGLVPNGFLLILPILSYSFSSIFILGLFIVILASSDFTNSTVALQLSCSEWERQSN